MVLESAPAIESLNIISDRVLEIKFEGMKTRFVDLSDFPLLGVAKELLTNPTLLKNFKLVDGVPEWDGRCLLGPEDLLKYSTEVVPVGKLQATPPE